MLDSPKACVKQGHPGPSISGAAEQEVLPDGHVTDEGEDEEHHAEHDEPQGAGYAHHSAPLRSPADTRTHRGGLRPHARNGRALPTDCGDHLREVERLRLRGGRDTSAGSNRPRSQAVAVAVETTESKRPRFGRATRRKEGATEPERDALTGDAGRGDTEGGSPACLCRHAAPFTDGFITCKGGDSAATSCR